MKSTQHTIRLPTRLFETIQLRALANRRSVNKEIEVMVTSHINAAVAADEATVAAMREKPQP